MPMAHPPVKETVGVRYATTNVVNPANVELEICQASRQDVFDPRRHVHHTSLFLVVALRQLNEIVNVTMKVKDDYFFITHGSEIYTIVLTVAPGVNVHKTAIKNGSNGEELQPQCGCFKIKLRSRHPSNYLVKIGVYHTRKNIPPRVGFTERRLVYNTEVDVCVPPSAAQRSLSRGKLTGILGRELGQKTMKQFKILVHEGQYKKLIDFKERLFEIIAKNVNYVELMCDVIFEETCALYGKNSHEEARTRIVEAFQLLSESFSASNEKILRAKLEIISAAIYRAEGSFDQARRALDNATELLADVEPGEETALLLYLRGALFADMSANMELTAEDKESAERSFEESRRHWLHNNHAHRTNRIPLWSSVRELCFLLKTQPQKAPRQDLAPDAADIARATELLTNVERSILPTCPAVIKTILLLASSDCYMYNSQPVKANDAATEARNIADALDLKKEIEGANERLTNIRPSLPVMENRPKVPACVDDDSVNTQGGASRDEEFERCLHELSLELRNHVIAEASD